MGDGLPRGWNLSAVFRAGTGTRYTKRPPANCYAARMFWDEMEASGPVEWVQLLDGYWGCQRPGADIPEEHEAQHYSRGQS